MPEGPLGFSRFTSVGPFVKTDKEAEWEDKMDESRDKLKELGL